MQSEVERGKLCVMVGGQYGSEGKGAIARHLADRYDVHVRVGSPNAGHTFYWNGAKHVMQSIPCGWINERAKIVIGRGALLNHKALMRELVHVMQWYPDFLERLYIDANAGVLDERFHEQEGGVELPADFDQDEFLRGAKAAYTRLQASWDRRDLDDIANFATEDVMRELREQYKADPKPGKTEILLVNASVIEVRDEGDLRRVAVYFDVLMREDQRAARPEQVREVWHFVCSRAEGDSWKLDGIQQLA